MNKRGRALYQLHMCLESNPQCVVFPLPLVPPPHKHEQEGEAGWGGGGGGGGGGAWQITQRLINYLISTRHEGFVYL